MQISEPLSPAPAVPGRWLRLVRRDDFSRLMGAAIEGTLVRRGRLAPGTARALRRDALGRFAHLMQARTRRVRAMTKAEHLSELEQTHGELWRARATQREELDTLGEQLRQVRREVSELTPEEELELGEALRADLVKLLASSTPQAGVAEVVARERVRRSEAVKAALLRERERIDLLERRLAKQRGAIEKMERSLVELARRAELDPGVPSIYREVQGLSGEEADRQAKLELLRSIFEQNVLLQKQTLQKSA
jgi:uncharacterized coiled-coil protein SlyX